MFYLYHHNDLKRLADLLEVMRHQHTGSPLAPDIVLTPNAGVGRWLKVQWAENEGIAANIKSELAGQFIWRLIDEATESGASTHFGSGVLLWHIYNALPVMADDIAEIAAYLGTPIDEIRRYQLAGRLTDVFDQYQIYRADTLARWENGEIPATSPGQWQARIWQWLTHPGRLGHAHRGRVLADFIRRLRTGPTMAERVTRHCPARLYCFGLMAMPPDYLRFLYALAEHVDIHFLLQNPSGEYWGDIEKKPLPLDLPENGDEWHTFPGEPKVADGHPLLAALGRMARDTVRLVYSDEFAGMVEPELGQVMAYDPPKPDTLLHRIQADIITLGCRHSKQGIESNDTSLEIHACHSRLREVQVLQDQILDRLAADDKRLAAGEITSENRLAPRDIIVMTPQIAEYGPAIKAVFGGAEADRYLPYGLADRAQAATHPLMTTFAALLDLPLWRWSASELLDLLAVPAVLRRFELTESELDLITHWVRESGIRWGRDGRHRDMLGAGAFNQNSWRFGLDRLLLGVAQSDDEILTAGVAPWSDLEGGNTAALGKLWRFETTLTDLAEILTQPATPGQWQTRLNRMVDRLMAPDPEDRHEQRAVDDLLRLFADLEAVETATCEAPLGASRELSWEAVREHLKTALGTIAEQQPFLSGGITFCGMIPLRAVPFRMVCLLGMNDSDFPRQDKNRNFNIMPATPRLGDRNMRDDDRLLFLQALTAARDAFYISYTGQDLRSGETLQPSPVVSEMLEFLHHHYFRDEKRETVDARLIHNQPMQPFSPRYFQADKQDSRIFTYADQWREATRASLGERDTFPSLLDDSEAPWTEPIEAISLDTLKRFFDHPARAFFRDRLKLRLTPEDENQTDDEPFETSALEAAKLARRLFERADSTHADTVDTEPSELELARGTLPPRPLAAKSHAAAAEEVNLVLPAWRRWQAEGVPETLSIQLDDIAGVRITGEVPDCWPGVLRRLRTGKLKTKYRLRYWIEYLAAVAAGHALQLELAGFKPVKGRREYIEYSAHIDPATARQELAALVRVYLDGQRRPLHYHPELDDEYNPGQSKAFSNITARFRASAYNPHHLRSDALFRLLLGPEETPLGKDRETSPFIACIDRISGPMNQHLTIAGKNGKGGRK